MNQPTLTARWPELLLAVLAALVLFGTHYFPAADPIFAQSTPLLIAHDPSNIGPDVLLQVIAPNILRVQPRFGARPPSASWVLNPATQWDQAADAQPITADVYTIHTGEMTVQIRRTPLQITVFDAGGDQILQESQFSEKELVFSTNNAENEHFYGAHSYQVWENVAAGMLRDNGGKVWASYQGDSGAPLLFSRRYGVLVDADSGDFRLTDATLRFVNAKQTQLQHFVIVGPPKNIMQRVAELSGKPPMLPKWALGFINSEWGIDEAELRQSVQTYRAKNIPLDVFALDFDYKAWGAGDITIAGDVTIAGDDYIAGEFRWNSNTAANKFPSGASGQLGQDMAAQGVHLMGIMKPRVHVQNAAGQATRAAQWLDQHGCWVAAQKAYIDYFSKLPVRDIDFGKPECRAWYWQQARNLFGTGIAAWWNDEADVTDNDFVFDTFQSTNMARALYEGQRADSQKRVFTLNRNFYLGAQRYAYAMWSGDIESTFNSMADQRPRMLASINTGAVKWGMDIGGFTATLPLESENYARWMQFGAFAPIYRVHGYLGQQRQPWHYNAPAEAAAKQAIQLRQQLLPYLYAYERNAYDTGIGIVRPLFYEFPDDTTIANTTSAWMFGEHLLVSPIMGRGQSHVSIYLPPGEWLDYFRGTAYIGGGTVNYTVNNLSDVPLFIRRGAIIPNHAPQNFVGERAIDTITLDVFPDVRATEFTYYDDDGESYAYENGAYFRQTMHTQQRGDEVLFSLDPPVSAGTYAPPVQHYLVKLHTHTAAALLVDGVDVPFLANAATLEAFDGTGWAIDHDQYGPVTLIKLPAGRAVNIRLVDGISPVPLLRSQVNLALNKPVSVSSTEQPRYAAAYAVDGDSGTRWSSLKDEAQFIQIDLGARYELARVVLNWEAATAADYKIEVSDSPEAGWSAIFSATGRNTVGLDNIAVRGAGRYIRLALTRRATESGYSLYDFEVYGPGR